MDAAKFEALRPGDDAPLPVISAVECPQHDACGATGPYGAFVDRTDRLEQRGDTTLLHGHARLLRRGANAERQDERRRGGSDQHDYCPPIDLAMCSAIDAALLA